MTQTITVTGMSCGHCEQTVEDALQSVTGVTGVSADHESEEAHIDGDADVAVLIEAVEDAGYTATA